MTVATKPDETRRRLTLAQLNAIDCLVAGKSGQETATVVGVTRQTVNVWRNHDHQFMAALNARRAAVWSAATDRLRALLPRALEVLEGALAADPDPKLALQVVRLAGLGERGGHLGAAGVGPTEAELVLHAEVMRRREQYNSFEAVVGGPVRAAERRALEEELAALAAEAGSDPPG